MEKQTKTIELDLTNNRDKLLLVLFENKDLLESEELSELRTIRTKINALIKEKYSSDRYGDKALDTAYIFYIQSLKKKLELYNLKKNLHNFFGSKDLKNSMFSADELLRIISSEHNQIETTSENYLAIIEDIEERLSQ